MELPKNITQIGEADRRCKIYVEDYVVSYIRQMNHLAENKDISLALYGIRKDEGEVGYVFLYGACRLESLQRETRHLSQAQSQEIERLRNKYFPEYQFLGYRLLNGEMVEGFHICEQGICRYIAGYACFYEKNDNMLAYMLEDRTEEAEPEKVDREKYERVRQRQENRRQEYQSRLRQNVRTRENEKEEAEDGRAAEELKERQDHKKNLKNKENANSKENQETGQAITARTARQSARGRLGLRSSAIGAGKTLRGRTGGGRQYTSGEKQDRRKEPEGVSSGTMHLMRLSVAGMFLLLCVIGLSTFYDNGGMENLQGAAQRLLAELMEPKLPDSGDVVSVMNPGEQTSTLYTEDELAEAIQRENEQAKTTESGSAEENQSGQGQSDVRQSGQSQPDGQQSGPSQSDGQQSGPSQPDGQQSGPSQPDGQQSAQGQSDSQQSEQNQQTGQEGQLPSEQQIDQQENSHTAEQGSGDGQTSPGEVAQSGNGTQSGDSSQEAPETQQPDTVETSQPQEVQEDARQASAHMTYTIQKGDTLTGISVSHYGTGAMVREICELNNITNPDDIYFGQKILLP